jgi:hypothetical protein
MRVKFYIQGELGNQMFQWATGIAFSKSTGKNIEFRVAPGYTFRLNEYTTRELQTSSVGFRQVQGSASALFKNLHSVVRRIPSRFVFDEKNLCYHEISGLSAKFFYGYFQSWRYFHHYQEDILGHFELTKPSKQFTELVSTLPEDFTAIHIRRGGSGAAVLSEKFHGLLDSDYYQRAIKLNTSLGGSTNYIVFTDNLERAKEALKKIGLRDVRVISPIDTQSQVENLQIMSLAKSFIGANSSYSWWAAYLAKELKTPPIFPRQWYMDPTISTNDLLLPDWISLGFSKFLNEVNVRGVK